jgi:hypothetical protein
LFCGALVNVTCPKEVRQISSNNVVNIFFICLFFSREMSEIGLAFIKDNRNVVCFIKANNPTKIGGGVIF